jgi:transposase
MRVDETLRKNGSTEIRIMEAVRIEGKPTHRTVKYIGQSKNTQILETMRKYAEELRIDLENEKAPTLLDPKEFYSKKNNRKKIPDDVRLNNQSQERIVNEGVPAVFGGIYEQLNFDRLICNTRKDEEWNKYLKQNVLARIANPNSKRKTVKYLSQKHLEELDLDKTYRMMDHVSKCEEKIKNAVYLSTKKLINEKVNVMFFDVTTLYFESKEEDTLREFGFSKDGKFNDIQVVLSLVTTTDGLPITYKLFPGSTNEGKTLITIIEELKNVYEINNVLLVADRAMFSEENLKLMEDNDVKFIIAAKLRGLKKTMKDSILSDNYQATIVDNQLCWAKEYDLNGRRLIASYSSQRAKKDQKDRNRLLDKMFKKVKNGKVKIKDLLSNQGRKKYIKVLKDEAILDTDKIAKDASWDGMHGVITNIKDQSISDILTRYKDLWQIEESFRINKHDLKMRPIFHWKRKRVEAHILICYLAYTLVRHAQVLLRRSSVFSSIENLIDECLDIDTVIVKDKQTKKLYGLPAKLNPVQNKIFKAFEISPEKTAFEIVQ